jgi:hypothetical protein
MVELKVPVFNSVAVLGTVQPHPKLTRNRMTASENNVQRMASNLSMKGVPRMIQNTAKLI